MGLPCVGFHVGVLCEGLQVGVPYVSLCYIRVPFKSFPILDFHVEASMWEFHLGAPYGIPICGPPGGAHISEGFNT